MTRRVDLRAFAIGAWLLPLQAGFALLVTSCGTSSPPSDTGTVPTDPCSAPSNNGSCSSSDSGGGGVEGTGPEGGAPEAGATTGNGSDASADVGADGNPPPTGDGAVSSGPDAGAGDTGSAATGPIVSGNQWDDQTGHNVQGHGGDIIRVGATYYWFGEEKLGESSANATFQHVTCSSSTDLVHWTFVAEALSQQASGDLGPKRIIERPKVIYSAGTSQYVMYMHVDTPGYGTAMVGVATSSTVCGPYTYKGSFKPLGLQSWDMNLFMDDDASAYLLTHAGDGYLHIEKLSADYLQVESSVASLTPNYEAPAIFKSAGRYYLLASHLTGWDTNDNEYATATSLSGPWSAWQTFAPPGSNTYNSQTMFVLPVSGSAGTTFVFMGDRWNPSSLGESTYVWLPLSVSGATVSMTWYGSWGLDLSTGAWAPNPGAIVSGGRYKLISYRSGFALDGGSAGASGTTVVQAADDGRSSETWRIVDVGSGYFKLLNQASGLALDNGNTATPGAGVIQYPDNGNPSQRWQLALASNGYYKVKNQQSGLILDDGNTTALGASVIQYGDNGGAPQKWELIFEP